MKNFFFSSPRLSTTSTIRTWRTQELSISGGEIFSVEAKSCFFLGLLILVLTFNLLQVWWKASLQKYQELSLQRQAVSGKVKAHHHKMLLCFYLSVGLKPFHAVPKSFHWSTFHFFFRVTRSADPQGWSLLDPATGRPIKYLVISYNEDGQHLHNGSQHVIGQIEDTCRQLLQWNFKRFLADIPQQLNAHQSENPVQVKQLFIPPPPIPNKGKGFVRCSSNKLTERGKLLPPTFPLL